MRLNCAIIFLQEAAINLGSALLKLDRSEEALGAYLRASAPGPVWPKALLGQALRLGVAGSRRL